GKASKNPADNQLTTKEVNHKQTITSSSTRMHPLYFNSTMPYPELAKKPAANLRELLLQKTYYDNDVFKSNEEIKKCEFIIDQIFETMEKLPSSKDHIERSIKDPRLAVRCITSDKFPGDEFEGVVRTSLDGRYNIMDLRTTFAEDNGLNNLNPSLHHEFRHADFTLLHQNEGCTTDTRSLPFFPTTHEMIEKFTKALDLGDARIRDFDALWQKELNREILTLKEKNRLIEYKEASKGCAVNQYQTFISESDYKLLLNQFNLAKINNMDITLYDGSDILLDLGGSGQEDDPYFMITKFVNDIDSFVRIPTRVRAHLSNGLYDYEGVELIAEREAYTMQGLSIKAMEVFYPEAYQMTQEFINICSTRKPVTDNKGSAALPLFALKIGAVAGVVIGGIAAGTLYFFLSRRNPRAHDE
ncbi:MAG: hypothetical protein ACK4M7_06780, partial [Burkholderiales bacterium]